MHLKIVVDVIKDRASTAGGREGAGYGSYLSKENGPALAPLVSSIWASHDLQTWWHKEEEMHIGGIKAHSRFVCSEELQHHSHRSTHSKKCQHIFMKGKGVKRKHRFTDRAACFHAISNTSTTETYVAII